MALLVCWMGSETFPQIKSIREFLTSNSVFMTTSYAKDLPTSSSSRFFVASECAKIYFLAFFSASLLGAIPSPRISLVPVPSVEFCAWAIHGFFFGRFLKRIRKRHSGSHDCLIETVQNILQIVHPKTISGLSVFDKFADLFIFHQTIDGGQVQSTINALKKSKLLVY
jgi:hypothetical protein